MLVCSVSLRPARTGISAGMEEVASATDALATGNVVFATLVDDPASVGDFVDAYLGSIMLEAASADTTVDAGLAFNSEIAEAVTAQDSIDATVPAATWHTTYSTLAFTTDNPGWNGYNVRLVVPSTQLAFSGSQVRATLVASLAAGGFVIDFAEIGHAAASGDPYDFDGGQVPLTFSGGSSGCTVAQGASILSDAITFNLDKTKNFVVALHFSGASAFRSSAATPVTSYYKSGASEVSVANVASYATLIGNSLIVSLIEAFA